MSIFTPIKEKYIEGWQYNGEDIPDDVVLAFARSGYLITHIPMDDNEFDEWGKPACVVTDRSGNETRYDAWEWVAIRENLYEGRFRLIEKRQSWNWEMET